MNEWIEPVELKDCPGFFHVPGNDRVAVSRDGCVISLKSKEILSQRNGNHGYPTIRHFKDNKRKTFTVHRLLGLTFIKIPENLKHIPRKKLQINHKDTVKTNYSLDNLEWCTPKENIQHGHDFGQHNLTRVLAKHVLTGEVQEFVNLASCSRRFGLHPAKLFKHLRSPVAGKITSSWHVFKYDNNSSWPELTEFDKVESKWQFAGIAIATNIELGMKVCHNSINEACESLGLDKTALGFHRFKVGSDVPFHGWTFKTYDYSDGVDTTGLKIGTRYKGRKKNIV